LSFVVKKDLVVTHEKQNEKLQFRINGLKSAIDLLNEDLFHYINENNILLLDIEQSIKELEKQNSNFQNHELQRLRNKKLNLNKKYTDKISYINSIRYFLVSEIDTLIRGIDSSIDTQQSLIQNLTLTIQG